MKTAAKVFLILSIISFVIAFLYNGMVVFSIFTVGSEVDPSQMPIPLEVLKIAVPIICVFFIVGIIIASIALHKLKVAKSARELRAISIVVLLFVNLIAGILMLLIKDDVPMQIQQQAIPNDTSIEESYDDEIEYDD